MKKSTIVFVVLTALFASTACRSANADARQSVAIAASGNRVQATPEPAASPQPAKAPVANAAPSEENESLIQVALLLDTSNSMDGLIDQAKAQLWRIVNELVKAKKGANYAKLQVALYEYGNDSLPSSLGYIRQVLPFSEDLDKISESLFALRTNGGSEFCGQVTFEAVRDLTWNNSPHNLKVIYIAGNEEYTQGPVPFRKAGKAASAKHVIINTIHCGGFDEGRRGQWHLGAKGAGGVYANIDQNKKPISIDAPQDDEIIALNAELNATYIAYGSHGRAASARQAAEDSNASKMSKSIMAKRAVSKASRLYNNSSWDLVDANAQQEVDLRNLDASQLPAELKGKTSDEIEAYIAEKAEERAKIQKRIAELERERAAYVAAETAKQQAEGEDTLDDVIVATLRKQAEAKGYTFAEM